MIKWEVVLTFMSMNPRTSAHWSAWKYPLLGMIMRQSQSRRTFQLHWNQELKEQLFVILCSHTFDFAQLQHQKIHNRNFPITSRILPLSMSVGWQSNNHLNKILDIDNKPTNQGLTRAIGCQPVIVVNPLKTSCFCTLPNFMAKNRLVSWRILALWTNYVGFS